MACITWWIPSVDVNSFASSYHRFDFLVFSAVINPPLFLYFKDSISTGVSLKNLVGADPATMGDPVALEQ